MELETREYTVQAGRIIKAALSGRLRISQSLLQIRAEDLKIHSPEKRFKLVTQPA